LLVLALTNSPAQTGLIAATESFPYLVLSLPGGALIDRLNRKALMIWCDVARVLAFGSIPLVFVLDRLDLPQLYLVALISGVTKVVFDIAALASLPNVVPPARFSQAASLNYVSEETAKLFGPTLGGALVGLGKTTLAGTTIAYLVDSLTYLVSVISLLFIKVPFQAGQAARPLNTLWPDIKEGLRFVWHQPHLRWMMLLTTGSNFLLSPLLIIIVVVAKDHLHLDAWLLGLTLSSVGLGGLLGALLAPRFLARFKPMPLFFGTLALWTCAITILALADSAWLIIIGYGLVGLTDPIFSINVITYRSILTPDHLQGRVISSFRVLTFGIEPVGLALGGFLLGSLGPTWLLWLIAAGLLLCTAASSLTLKLK
jgi:MFS family permease